MTSRIEEIKNLRELAYYSDPATGSNTQAQAQVALANRYEYFLKHPVEEIDVNPREITRLYQLAANQGNAEGQYYLGRYCLKGRVTRNKAKEGITWLKKAAKQNYVPALFDLGVLFRKGEFLQKPNTVKAALCFRQAALLGDAKGQYNFALCLLKGAGVARSWPKAMQYLRKAADQGIPEAIALLTPAAGPVAAQPAQAAQS